MGPKPLSPAPLTLTRAPLQSPEKLQAALEEMGAAVERVRAAAAEAERRLRASASRSEHVSKVIQQSAVTILANPIPVPGPGFQENPSYIYLRLT